MSKITPQKRVRVWDIAESLRKEIINQRLVPDSPIMSTRELSARFNVSPLTANRALNKLVDDNLLYRVQGSGSYVKGKDKPKRRLLIGLVESITNQGGTGFYAAHGIFIDTALNELREKDCDVRYFSYNNLLKLNFQKDSLYELDGLVVNSSCIDKKTLALFENFSGPITIYGNEFQLDVPFNQVMPNLEIGFQELFQHLDRSVVDGIVTMSVRHSNADAREKHFIEIALRSGFQKENVEEVEVKAMEGDNGRISGCSTAKKILSRCIGKLLFSTSDFVSFGIIDAMKELNMQPGRELQLVSYDNLEHYGMRPFGEAILSSVDYPKDKIARKAVDLTIELAGQNDICQHIVKIPTHLVVRKTGLVKKLTL
jgi:DNA-binding LacI/PurR family transcriptional regulator